MLHLFLSNPFSGILNISYNFLENAEKEDVRFVDFADHLHDKITKEVYRK